MQPEQNNSLLPVLATVLGSLTGPEGKQGERGEKGDTGEAGPQGQVGPQGPAGKDGADGKDGKDGVDGIDGKDGERGEKGDKGDTGPAGRDGADGKDGQSVTSEMLYEVTVPIIVQNVQKAVSSKTITTNDVEGLLEFVQDNSSGGPGGAAAWGDITGTLSAQTDLQTALDSKAATSHTHAIADVTGLQTALDGKAATLGADDNYVTDAEKVKLSNLSGTNTGDQNLAPYLLSATAATTYEPIKGADDNFVTDAEKVKLSNLSGTNTGDQTSIVGITGTKAQFNTAVTDGDILYTDAIGSTVQGYSAVLAATTASFTTADETKLDGIAAGAEVNVNADWNAVSGDAQILNKPTISGTNTGDQTSIVGITGTKAQFDTAVTDGNFLYVGDVTTNATHTGEVTGSGTLTVDKTAITNKTLVTAAVGDHILIADASDTDNLKRVTVQTIVDLAGGGAVSDAAYDASWNGDTTTAPSKNAVYDKIETLSGGSGLTQAQVLTRLSFRF